ncbi:Uncharacterized protein Adt_21407 [Abeliophyllum distichum]|uniref:Uncharacterized protein n=1 Tax=Abeliophyllum distichum TaxID=126358 RepID=A0ABD1SZ89_9LAMI
MKGMLKFLEKLTSEKHEVRNVQQSIWAKVKAERAPRWPGIEEYASWPRLGQRLEPGTRAHQRLAMDPIFQTKRTRKTLTTFLGYYQGWFLTAYYYFGPWIAMNANRDQLPFPIPKKQDATFVVTR